MAFKAVAKSNPDTILQPSLPRQAIPLIQKDEKWRKSNVDAIQNMANNSGWDGRTSRYRKQINYNLVNNVFDVADFKYVLDPYGIGADKATQTAQLRNFNLIAGKIQLLKGEEWETPFGFEVIGVNGEVVTAVSESRKEAIINGVRNKLKVEYNNLQRNEDGATVPELRQVVDNFNRTYRDIREKNAGRILEYHLYKQKLREKFNLGFEHALICSEEIYYIGIGDGGHPVLRTVNSLNFDYDKNPDVYCIEDCEWAREDRWLSPSQIIDLYGSSLTDKQVEKIEDGSIGSGLGYRSGDFPGYLYMPADYKINLVGSDRRSSYSVPHVLVSNCVWKSRTKRGFLTEVTPDGEINETIVDETYKLTSEQKQNGVIIEWEWFNEVWQGTKIGNDEYVDIEPIPNQIRSEENPKECKLPYVGRIYNSLNTAAISFVEMLKPHQYLYNIVWYRLESELAKAKGKAFVMDLAQIPRSHGIDLQEWIYYFENAGIAFINSMEEGEDMFKGKTTSFNQFTDIDRTLSNVVGQYILILNKIEQMVDTISGISPQRASKVKPTETATGVRTAVDQSGLTTAPWFQMHNSCIEQALTQLLETAKIAYSDGKKASFIVDEVYRQTIDIDGDILNDSDYGVFVTNSVRNKIIRKKIESLAEVAIQSNLLELGDLIRIYKSTSNAEAEGIFDDSVAKRNSQRLKEVEIQNQAIIEKGKQELELALEKLNREDARAQLDSTTDITVARIQALAKLGVADYNQNEVLDVLEEGDKEVKQAKLLLEREKLASMERIKNREIEQKERDSRRKLQIARENKNKYD
jgi:hypothetical protein